MWIEKRASALMKGASSKEELVAKVEEHGKKDHHITNIDPETRHKVESAIHKQAA